jgi:hypothetical protein
MDAFQDDRRLVHDAAKEVPRTPGTRTSYRVCETVLMPSRAARPRRRGKGHLLTYVRRPCGYAATTSSSTSG